MCVCFGGALDSQQQQQQQLQQPETSKRENQSDSVVLHDWIKRSRGLLVFYKQVHTFISLTRPYISVVSHLSPSVYLPVMRLTLSADGTSECQEEEEES